MKLKFLIFIFALSFNSLKADDYRYKTEFPNRDTSFILTFDSVWVLKNRTGKNIYIIDYNVLSDMSQSGIPGASVFISDDGNSIIIADDCPSIFPLNSVSYRNALWFLYKGSPAKKYKVTEILEDTGNISCSASHWSYFVEIPSVDFSKNSFSFSTYEFYTYTFNTNTGELISKSRPKGFDDQTIIVVGKFSKWGNKKAKMRVSWYLAGSGQSGDDITFKTTFYGDGNWTRAVMIKNGKDITPPLFRNGMCYNRCLIH